MQRYDGLACPRRTGDACRSVVVALDHLALRRVQEHGPLVPRKLQCAFELLGATDEPEPAPRVRMRERIGLRPQVELVAPGTLPRFELKAKRFFKL